MILCEEVKFETLILIGSKCTHGVICLFKRTIKQTIHSVNSAVARWVKHKIYYVSNNGKNNKSKCVCLRYEILMQKQIQIGLSRRRM